MRGGLRLTYTELKRLHPEDYAVLNHLQAIEADGLTVEEDSDEEILEAQKRVLEQIAPGR